MLEVLKTEKGAQEISKILAKAGIKKSATKIMEKANVVLTLVNMGEALVWQVKSLEAPDREKLRKIKKLEGFLKEKDEKIKGLRERLNPDKEEFKPVKCPYCGFLRRCTKWYL